MYVLVILVVAAVPIILDICLAYRLASKTQNLLKDKIPGGLKPAELEDLILKIGKVPPGIPGLARATMTLTVILILGVAILHALVIGIPADDSQIANNILSILAGLLAAMTGFYFGGKKKEEEKEEKPKTTKRETEEPAQGPRPAPEQPIR